MYFVLTRMPGESYRKRLRPLLLYLCYVFRALINSLVHWFCASALGLVLFQNPKPFWKGASWEPHSVSDIVCTRSLSESQTILQAWLALGLILFQILSVPGPYQNPKSFCKGGSGGPHSVSDIVCTRSLSESQTILQAWLLGTQYCVRAYFCRRQDCRTWSGVCGPGLHGRAADCGRPKRYRRARCRQRPFRSRKRVVCCWRCSVSSGGQMEGYAGWVVHSVSRCRLIKALGVFEGEFKHTKWWKERLFNMTPHNMRIFGENPFVVQLNNT